MARLEMKCSYCGGTNVLLDAWAEWDVDKQEWTLQNIFHNAFCEDCEGETSIEECVIEE
jgi:hypothetical protein